MKILIETGQPRNYQCGDWFEDQEGIIKIVTTEMPLKSQVAVAVHELVEKLLCDEAGVTDNQVTMFDAQFENERETGKHAIDAEPGNDPRSPYKTQHEAATFAERAVCAALALDWKEHEQNVLRSSS
jgi:hypothetical protein